MTLHASRSLRKKASLAAIGFVAAAALAAATAVAEAQEAFSERFPNLVLKTHEGKTVRFYDDLLKGKIVMINFMYATCKGR